MATVRVMNSWPAVILLYNGQSFSKRKQTPQAATINGEPQSWRRPPPGLPLAPIGSPDPTIAKCRHHSIIPIYKAAVPAVLHLNPRITTPSPPAHAECSPPQTARR